MKPGAWWPIGITGVLATTVAANLWVMRIANDDPSFAIEPDYYQKAITWDSTLAQARQDSILGWRLTPRLEVVAATGKTRISATLTDSSGMPIAGAVVRVSALPVARASEVHEATLAAAGVGEYSGQLDAQRQGQWELRFDVRAGSARFTDVVRAEAR
ncbi:MAG TPA: FixH family protein [Gemmatimonadaceae bacterium]|jgi:nitrogen fixation protein FixH|nr:FixH family protein [Gemmatimonadaceae bacterium]